MLTEQGHAQQLFDVLFDGDDMVELRFLPSAGSGLKPMSKFYNSHGEATYDWEWIEEQIDKGYDIYFGANPRSERSGKAESITYARSMFVDFDDAETVEQVKERISGLPEPSAIVHSGRGFHVYWRLLSRENDMQRWSRFQKGLIEHCGSDKAIHDPPRIMRMPGTVNHKNGKRCRVVEMTSHRVAEDIAQVFPEPTQAAPLYGTEEGRQAELEGKYLPLSRKVSEWLSGETPAPEGTRHATMVQAIYELIGNGWGEASLKVVRQAADRDGKDPDEVERAIRDALNRKSEITPSLNNAPKPAPQAENAEDQPIIEKAYVENVRPVFSNVVRCTNTQKEDGKPVDHYKPIDVIAEDLRRATKDWPQLSKGTLFYPTGVEDSPFRIIVNPDQLFAFIHEHTSPRWVSGKDLYMVADNTPRSAITKREFFEYLCNQQDRYQAIEILPHEPPIPGAWYAPIDLPEPSDKFDELVSRMNGETVADNELIKAMIATPFAGIDPGSRPLFVLQSKHGRATGKSTTADIVHKLAGLAADISVKESWDQIAKKLVDQNGMNGRVVRIDNVKDGRISSAELESAITAEEITGHRMYRGSARRQNNLTWIMTANTPNLSTDIATRSVIINIGEAKHEDTTFKTWLGDFLAEHRKQIIADILAWLRGPSYRISPCNFGRFPKWTMSVLAKFERADELAEHVAEQRVAADSEREDAEDWAAVIGEIIKDSATFPVDLEKCCVAMRLPDLHGEFVRRTHSDLNAHGFSALLRKLTVNPPLKHMKYERVNAGGSRGQRFWVWRTAGPEHTPTILHIHDGGSYPQ